MPPRNGATKKSSEGALRGKYGQQTETLESSQPSETIFTDVESSEEVVGTTFYPHKVSVMGSPRGFNGTMTALGFGPVVIGELDYNVCLELECPHISAYHLNVPVKGSVSSTSQGVEVYTEPGKAALYRYESGAILRTVSDFEFNLVALKIDKLALDNALAALLGRPLETSISFDPEIDLRTGLGCQWWQLVRNIRAGSADNPLLKNPMVANPLGLALLNGLLMASGHQFTELLRYPPRPAPPPVVRLAEDYIIEHLHEPITVTEVAAQVRLSARSLQRGFLEYLGMTPYEYIRSRRLHRAHTDLAAGDSATTRISDVASRWGFPHVGRFAAAYRQTYGVTPTQTLRS